MPSEENFEIIAEEVDEEYTIIAEEIDEEYTIVIEEVAGLPGSSTFAGLTDAPEDNELLAAALDAKADDTDLISYQLLSEKAVANGYASLDGSGKVPTSQLPVIANQLYTGGDTLPYADTTSVRTALGVYSSGQTDAAISAGLASIPPGTLYSGGADLPYANVGLVRTALSIYSTSQVDTLLSNKQNTLTGISDVPNLVSELNAKQDTLGGTADVPGLDTQLSNKQPLNSNLTELSALADSNGVLTNTGGTLSWEPAASSAYLYSGGASLPYANSGAVRSALDLYTTGQTDSAISAAIAAIDVPVLYTGGIDLPYANIAAVRSALNLYSTSQVDTFLSGKQNTISSSADIPGLDTQLANKQPLNSNLTEFSGLADANGVLTNTGGTLSWTTAASPYLFTGGDALPYANAGAVRSALDLYTTGETDAAISDAIDAIDAPVLYTGGSALPYSNVSAVRSALSLYSTSQTDTLLNAKQPLNANLTEFGGLVDSNGVLTNTGGTLSWAALTAPKLFTGGIDLPYADATAVRTALSVYSTTQADTNFQPKDADLTAFAALTQADGYLKSTSGTLSWESVAGGSSELYTGGPALPYADADAVLADLGAYSSSEVDAAIAAIPAPVLYTGGSNLPYANAAAVRTALSLYSSTQTDSAISTAISAIPASKLFTGGGDLPYANAAAVYTALGQATTSTNGFLSSTDWNTFNGKFATPSGLTNNYVSKWNGTGFVNSSISDSSGQVALNSSALVLDNAATPVSGLYSIGLGDYCIRHTVPSSRRHEFANNSTVSVNLSASGIASGLGTTESSAPLHARSSTGAQQIWDYSSGVQASLTVDSGGNLTLNHTGNRLALGGGANYTAAHATAIGDQATADYRAVALGASCSASAIYGIAIGYGPAASDDYAIAIGTLATGSADYAIAVGYGANAYGFLSAAIGSGASAGEFGLALGYEAVNYGYGVSIGAGCTTDNVHSIAIGYSCIGYYRSCHIGGPIINKYYWGQGYEAVLPDTVTFYGTSSNDDGEDPVDGGGLSFVGGAPTSGGTYGTVRLASNASYLEVAENFVSINTNTLGVLGATPVGRGSAWSITNAAGARRTFDTSTVTLPQLAEIVATLLSHLGDQAGFGFLDTNY